MSGVFEQLIEALNRNTEALNANSGAAPADAKKTTTTKTTGGKGTTTTKTKPAHTKAEATEVVVTVKDTMGVEAAKKLLADHGFKKVADLTEDKFDVVFEQGTELLEAHKAENGGGEEEDI